jgi:hypothetical protein
MRHIASKMTHANLGLGCFLIDGTLCDRGLPLGASGGRGSELWGARLTAFTTPPAHLLSRCALTMSIMPLLPVLRDLAHTHFPTPRPPSPRANLLTDHHRSPTQPNPPPLPSPISHARPTRDEIDFGHALAQLVGARRNDF